MKYLIGFLLGFITMFIIIIKVFQKCIEIIIRLELSNDFKEFLISFFDSLLYGPRRYRRRPRFNYESYARYRRNRDEHSI